MTEPEKNKEVKKADTGEIVTVELSHEAKIRLYGQITSRMQQMGFESLDYAELDLGFELPAGWPADRDCEVTLARLVVIAQKLKMKLTITDIYIEPRS